MKKILICQHGGSSNHGCEALVRTAVKLISELPVKTEISVYSYRLPDDKKYISDLPVGLYGLQTPPGKFSPYNLYYQFRSVMGKPIPKLPITAELKKLIDGADLVIAVGGDNYCYNSGRGYYALDRYIVSRGKPYMLLGASIEPQDLKGELAGHLRIFDAVTIRESISMNAMTEAGLDRSVYAPDGAFLLETVPTPLPDGFDGKNTVGINLSPLIMQSEKKPGITMENYRVLVRCILEKGLNVAFIPHVVWLGGDDREPMKALYEEFRETGKVCMVPDADARHIKGVIASLHSFVGARTHATIAAYSSCVPTLVVGYSVKARGIAVDLFGTEEGFVRPVQSLEEPEDLAEAWNMIYSRRDELALHLEGLMPEYKEKAKSVSTVIGKLLGVLPKDAPCSPKECCGCGLCAAKCPVGAIDMVTDSEGFSYPRINDEKCIRCGLCERLCPVREWPERKSDAYAARSSSEDERRESTSGGVFSILAREIISRGGTVFGAAFRREAGTLKLVHTAARTEAELAPLRGSKYVQSDLTEFWKLADDALAQGPVLFCGTPCQCAAVRSAYPNEEKLYICQVICHGAPSPKVFDKYVRELSEKQGAAVTDFRFRDKSTGWATSSVKVFFGKGEPVSIPGSADPYMRAFLSDLSTRPSCGSCMIRSSRSGADITLGDLWGSGSIAPSMDDGKGVSAVIVHSSAGQELLHVLEKAAELRSISEGDVAKYNPCLVRPAPSSQRREAFFAGIIRGKTVASLLEPPKKRSFISRVIGKLKRMFFK